MSQSDITSDAEDRSSQMNGEELVSRVFTVSMVGVCAAILLMIIIGDW